MRVAWLLLILGLAAGVGCVRHIVASPEMARSLNDVDWHIERQPDVAPRPSQQTAEPVAP